MNLFFSTSGGVFVVSSATTSYKNLRYLVRMNGIRVLVYRLVDYFLIYHIILIESASRPFESKLGFEAPFSGKL
jgi:hypothetical protein